MASLIPIRGKRGISYAVQFCNGQGGRPTVRLGAIPKKIAETAKVRIEHLVAAKTAGHSVDSETARWLASLSNSVYRRLVRAGLTPARQASPGRRPECMTVEAIAERYISRRELNLTRPVGRNQRGDVTQA